MLIKRKKGWEIPERLATPEAVYLNRRQILAASSLGLIAATLPALALAENDPTADLYPAPRNSKYTIDRPVTPEFDQHQLQQLLRIRHPQEHCQRCRSAADPTVGGQDRWDGRAGADLQHRRADPKNAA